MCRKYVTYSLELWGAAFDSVQSRMRILELRLPIVLINIHYKIDNLYKTSLILKIQTK